MNSKDLIQIFGRFNFVYGLYISLVYGEGRLSAFGKNEPFLKYVESPFSFEPYILERLGAVSITFPTLS